MMDDRRARLFHHAPHEFRIGYVALTENRSLRDVIYPARGEIIHHPDGIARLQAGFRNMGADEAGASRHQHVRHLKSPSCEIKIRHRSGKPTIADHNVNFNHGARFA